LSHIRTEDALTYYLAHKLLINAQRTSKKFVVAWLVAWRAQAVATNLDIDFFSSTQKEARSSFIPSMLKKQVQQGY